MADSEGAADGGAVTDGTTGGKSNGMSTPSGTPSVAPQLQLPTKAETAWARLAQLQLQSLRSFMHRRRPRQHWWWMVHEVVSKCDVDGNNSIDFQEFLALFKGSGSAMRASTRKIPSRVNEE